MSPLDALTFSVPSAAGPAHVGGQGAVGTSFPDAPASSRASISDLGRAMSELPFRNASNVSSRYQDIDDSDLPDKIKHLLRMIRDLREKLAELARDLQAVQADEDMAPEAKRARLRQIQAQMGMLHTSLVSATQKLSSLVREMKLDKAQQMVASKLAMA